MDEKAARLEAAPDSLGELPWLVYTHGNSKRKQVQSFYSPINSKGCIRSIPQLRHKKLLMFKHGWLLLQDRSQLTNLSLFNPVTSQAIGLPPLLQVWLDVDDVESWFSFCVLTLPPDRDDCMLLLCSNSAGLLAFGRPAQPGCTWVSQPLELQGEAVTVAHLVALNGVFYGITSTHVLFCAEDKNDLKTLVVKPLQANMNPVADFYADGTLRIMLESCGHLYNVVLYFVDSRRIIAVKVFELNLQQKQNSYSWVEVKSLNGRAFFISNNDASWCWGDSIRRITGDCVYFCVPELLETLYLYNLLDQTCIALPPYPSSFVSPCDYPLWVISQQQQQQQQQSRLSTSEERKESIQKTGFVNQKVSPIECHEFSQTHDEDDILSKLPFHIIELVANHMHLFEYWSFRVSCKILISRLPKPHQRSTSNRPLFMVFNQNHRLCTIIDPCRHDSRSNNSVLPSHQDSLTLEFSKSGWVFYLVGKKFLEYANVLTRVHGRFPSLPPVHFDIHFMHYKSIAFSTYPTCSDCLTVAIYGDEEEVAFSYIGPGDGAWNTSYFRHEYDPFRPTRSTPVFINGAFYYLDVSGCLGEFRLMDEPTWQVYYDKPQIQGDTDTLYLSSLVECNGQLYSIFVGNMGNWIQVFWFDYPTNKCWVEIHDLENVSFFVSRKSSLSIVTNDDQLRNKIFLPWIRDKAIVYYSLSTKRYHIWGLDDVRYNLLGLGEPQWSCWF